MKNLKLINRIKTVRNFDKCFFSETEINRFKLRFFVQKYVNIHYHYNRVECQLMFIKSVNNDKDFRNIQNFCKALDINFKLIENNKIEIFY